MFKRTTIAWLTLLPLVLVLPFLSGANCSPSRPGCDGRGACADIESPQRSCINFCGPEWDPASGLPSRCPMDPCDAFAIAQPMAALCPSTHRCVDDGAADGGNPTFGICEPALDTFLEECGAPTGIFDQCGSGMVCLGTECPRVASFLALGASATGDDVCFTPVREGQLCDSNVADRDVIDPATGELARVGCAPCEYGTWCLPNSTSGVAGPPDETRCIRACRDAFGEANDGMCSCAERRCEQLDAPVSRPFTGEDLGAAFCQPCLRSQAGGCGEDGLGCCDREASCNTATDVIDGTQVAVCCRPRGSSCDPGAAVPQCCQNATCVATGDGTGTCAPCGAQGDSAEQQQCCPGLAAINVGSGSAFAPVCAACADYNGLVRDAGLGAAFCGEEFFLGRADTGRVDVALIPNPRAPWSSVFEGQLGGQLDATVGSPGLSAVEMNLYRDHRAWVFDEPPGVSMLRAPGLTVGTRMLGLPRMDSSAAGSAPMTVAMPDGEWDSWRVYDGGACSLLIPWNAVAALLMTRVNQEMFRYAFGPEQRFSGLQNIGVTVEPILLSGLIERAYGALLARDGARIIAQWRADGAAGCSNVTMTMTLAASIGIRPGFNETPTSRLEVANGAQVGCTRDDGRWRCVVPTRTTPYTTEVVFFRSEDDYYEGRPVASTVDHLLSAGTWCRAERGAMHCSWYSLRDDFACDQRMYPDCPWAPSSSRYLAGDPYDPRIEREYAELPLSVAWVPEAHDLAVDVAPPEFDISDPCTGEAVTTEIVELALEKRLVEIEDELADLLGGVLGTSATRAYGVAATDLVSCASSSGAPDSDLCHVTPQFGGRRHSCAATDAGLRCDTLRIEPRRVNVRPDGIEIVMAEDEDDPQFPLASVSVSPLQPPLVIPLCQAERYDATDISVEPTPLADGRSQFYLGGSLPDFCDPSSADTCPGVCQQVGSTCTRASLQIAQATFVPPDAVRFSCIAGRCCDQADHSQCAITPSP